MIIRPFIPPSFGASSPWLHLGSFAAEGPELPRQPLFGGEALQGDVLEWKAGFGSLRKPSHANNLRWPGARVHLAWVPTTASSPKQIQTQIQSQNHDGFGGTPYHRRVVRRRVICGLGAGCWVASTQDNQSGGRGHRCSHQEVP